MYMYAKGHVYDMYNVWLHKKKPMVLNIITILDSTQYHRRP
jgi:hypothetical protein